MIKAMASALILFSLYLVSVSAHGEFQVACLCSPTDRGYRKGVAEDLYFAKEILEDFIDVHKGAGDGKEIEIAEKSRHLWNQCVVKYSLEECVNADSSRTADSFCDHVKNVENSLPSCKSRKIWRSQHPQMRQLPLIPKKPLSTAPLLPHVDITITIPWAPVRTPRPKAPAEKARKIAANVTPVAATRTPASQASTAPMTAVETQEPPSSFPLPTPEPVQSLQSVSSIATRTPTATRTPISLPSISVQTTPSPRPSNSPSPSLSPFPEVDFFAPEPPPTPRGLTEGCVAVENIPPEYILQHANHLWRTVLCARENGTNFCATPNHAIIVQGQWTSMKQLCTDGGWNCSRTMKFVNNLSVLVKGNRRFRVGRIVVTPFDIRFPRWIVWGVQIGQHLLSYSFLLVPLSAIILILLEGNRTPNPKLRGRPIPKVRFTND